MREKLIYYLSSLVPVYCHLCKKVFSPAFGQVYYCNYCAEQIQSLIKIVELPRLGLNNENLQLFGAIDYHIIQKEFGLVSSIKSHNKKFLLQGILPFIPILENIPKPDEIIYIPLSLRKFLERGFNPSYQVAKYTASIFGVPVKKVLKKNDTLSQSSRNREERIHMMNHTMFSLKNLKPSQKKCIMIVDDIITTGATISNVTQLILPFYPKDTQVFGFGLFHAEK